MKFNKKEGDKPPFFKRYTAVTEPRRLIHCQL